jgi:cytochrome c-type biogenesis protein CcmH/NrfG
MVEARTAPAAERAGHCREAIDAAPGRIAGHVCLGAALARDGDAEGAIESYRRALRIASEKNDPKFARRIRAKLEELEPPNVR